MEHFSNGEQYRDTMRKLLKIKRLHRSAFENNVARLGIHHSQHHLLMYLAKNPETPSQKEIASAFQISPSAVAVTLKKLETLGYVKRENETADNRIKKITITEKGKEIVENTHILFSETDKNVFNGLSEEELEKLNNILNKMTQNLEKINEVQDNE